MDKGAREATVLTVSDAEAETAGMERREGRRTNRQERRQGRRTGREARPQVAKRVARGAVTRVKTH